jgi:hypothetical protein
MFTRKESLMNTGTLMLAWLLAASPASGDVYYINQHQLRIPISVDPARRAEINQLILFMSADEGKTWNEQAVASPDQDAFPFYAPKDGMYWFTVCVVNHQGKREPSDLSSIPPSQKILIDTLKPMARIRAERQGEEIVVNWEIQEEHLDPASLKLEFRAADAPQWTPAPILTPAASGGTRFRSPGFGPVTLRFQAQDLAGNLGTADYELAAQMVAPGQQAPPSLPVQGTVTAAPNAQVSSPLNSSPAPLPTGPTIGNTTPTVASDPQLTQTSLANRSEPHVAPDSTTAPAPINKNSLPNPSMADLSKQPVASTDGNANVIPSNPWSGIPRPVPGHLPQLQYINTRQISIDYQVTKAGPSGIAKVELWATRNDGQTWEKFADNPNLKPPMVVDLKEEGVYGFRVVVQSKAGRYQPPPTAGSRPEVRVELDVTPPAAQLFRPEPDPKQNDTLMLSWNATDKNLTPTPITIQWAEDPGKEWQTIVADYPNEGRYPWKLPKDVPYMVYLRLTVKDTAGNVSTAETPNPICIDLTEPEAVIREVRIAGTPRRP